MGGLGKGEGQESTEIDNTAVRRIKLFGRPIQDGNRFI